MEEFLYDQFYSVERTHWWFAGMRRIFHQFLAPDLDPWGRARVLDVGCGTGIFIEELQVSARVFGVDMSEPALDYTRRRCPEAPLVRGDLTALPFAPASVDVVVALDVIEHLPDDRAGLAEIRRVLVPGGTLLVNVPAFPSLWSQKDVANHHYRRYRRRGLRDVLAECGFDVARITYTNTALFPVAWLVRRFDRLRGAQWDAEAEYHPNRLVNAAMLKVLDAERRALTHIDMPFGVSLTCLARRR